MSPEVLDRIFDPFYTTRTTGRGLGLAAVQGILQRLDGAMFVQSEPGVGSTFTIALPAAKTATTAAEIPDVDREGLPNLDVNWILVLDDEPLVRSQLVRILARAGLDARGVGSVAEAEDLLRQSRPQIALIDYLMPDMPGDEALLRLRRIAPGLPALLVSGYVSPGALSSEAIFDGQIAKPFAPAELVSIVQQHMEEKAADEVRETTDGGANT
jgi:two-component system cell cycle sensor histidine kinase/response regulator CckA